MADNLTYNDIIDLYARLRADQNQRNGEYDLARRRVDGMLWGDSSNPTPKNRYSLSANYLLPITMKHVQLLVGRLPGIQVMPYGTDEIARRHAEKLEAVLYSAWAASNAMETFQRVAWDSFVLRRGLIYYWWDTREKRAKFKYCTPDDYYPEYDGDVTYRAIYVHRRNIHALRQKYPKAANTIVADPPADVEQLYGQDQPRIEQTNYVSVKDYYDADGNFVRIVGDSILEKTKLGYPTPEVPFIEFPCYPSNGNREPKNGIDQLVELTQYLSQLISQKADVIRTYANPTILDKQSGQDPEEIRRAVSADGSVLPIARDSEIEFLNWSGSTPAIDEQITQILDIIFDISGKPRSSFGQTVTNQSGVVTNLALTPTLQSNEYHETIWGHRLSELNRRLLEITEKFAKGELQIYRGNRPAGADHKGSKVVSETIKGEEIRGWYENRIKWPSAIRTDDPVYIQNMLSQLTSDPPALSLYSVLEKLGTEDVEAEIDRILEQLEDPRLHPDRLEAGVNAANQASGPALAGELLGVPGSGGPPASGGAPPTDSGLDGDTLGASASPYREELS